MSDILEINASTGEQIERDYTPEENAKIEKMRQDAEEYILSLPEALDNSSYKISAIEKLKSLGLTEEEAKAIAGI